MWKEIKFYSIHPTGPLGFSITCSQANPIDTDTQYIFIKLTNFLAHGTIFFLPDPITLFLPYLLKSQNLKSPCYVTSGF